MDLTNYNLVAALDSAARYNFDSPAIVDGATGERISYDSFRRRTVEAARALKQNGLGEGDFVTLLARQSPEFHVVWWGCLRAGVVPAPLHPHETTDAIGEMNQRVSPDAFFYHEEYRDTAEQAGLFEDVGTAVDLGDAAGSDLGLEEFLSDAGDEPLERDIQPDDVASVFYSSGSTGVPKPVVQSHRFLVEYAHAGYVPLRSGRGDVYVNPQATSFAVQMTNLFYLTLGGTVVTVDGWSPDTYLEHVERFDSTAVILIPPQFDAVVEELETGSYDVSSVTRAASGGAPLRPGLKQEIERRFDCPVADVYASSECGIMSFLLPDDPERYAESVGKPAPNTEIKVVDPDAGDGGEELEPLEPGETGEILVRGLQVSEGVYGDTEATREMFAGDGWCRTGDAGRFDSDGYLYVTGRVDNVISTGGMQVYAENVESVIESHEDVKEAAVVGVEDERFGERVKAFVVISGEVGEGELLNWLNEHPSLADHEVPRGLEFIDVLPRTSTGKKARDEIL